MGGQNDDAKNDDAENEDGHVAAIMLILADANRDTVLRVLRRVVGKGWTIFDEEGTALMRAEIEIYASIAKDFTEEFNAPPLGAQSCARLGRKAQEVGFQMSKLADKLNPKNRR